MTHCTAKQLIAFETRIKDLWESGDLRYLLHLSGGNEEPLISLFQHIKPGDWVFGSHRSHYHYLLCGGTEEQLEREIREGRSMFLYGRFPPGRFPSTINPQPSTSLITSSVLAGVCGIAAGVAWTIKNGTPREAHSPVVEMPHVWCFVGDGAEDEGHFYEVLRFVDGHNLPCTFIIEDNDRSVDTSKVQRRGCDDVFFPQWSPTVIRYHYKPTYPHAGSGCKHTIKFKN